MVVAVRLVVVVRVEESGVAAAMTVEVREVKAVADSVALRHVIVRTVPTRHVIPHSPSRHVIVHSPSRHVVVHRPVMVVLRVGHVIVAFAQQLRYCWHGLHCDVD